MFCKQRSLMCSAIAALGLVTYSVFAETDTVIPETPEMVKKIKAWEECEKRVTAREKTICEKDPDHCGIGATGYVPDVQTECGYKPGSQLTKIQNEGINEICKYKDSVEGWSNAERGYVSEYGENSTVWKLADKKCARVYADYADERAQEAEKERQEKLKKEAEERRAKALEKAKPFGIERTYQMSDNYVGVIIRTDRTRLVKCALLNSDDEYLRVETAIMTPPVDEMTIRSDGVSWYSVRCWTSEPL